jgi:2-polyprenyl-3-methyl-5-hydroxy-6-metoxy-1,4-benzoquinol methylase
MQVIQDLTNQYIATILSQCDLTGKDVLEIGCGKGRITRDLALRARRVLATDPDADALKTARSAIAAANVAFMLAPSGVPDLPAGSFDVVIYTLSLHHVPVAEMPSSLRKAADLLRENGVIIVVEPAEGGSFTDTKERFGAGSGDERPAQESAIRAMHSLEGWTTKETVLFRTLFQFDNEEDFLANMLPDYQQKPEPFVAEVRRFLDQHRASYGIVLDAYRRLNLLHPSVPRDLW